MQAVGRYQRGHQLGICGGGKWWWDLTVLPQGTFSTASCFRPMHSTVRCTVCSTGKTRPSGALLTHHKRRETVRALQRNIHSEHVALAAAP